MASATIATSTASAKGKALWWETAHGEVGAYGREWDSTTLTPYYTYAEDGTNRVVYACCDGRFPPERAQIDTE